MLFLKKLFVRTIKKNKENIYNDLLGNMMPVVYLFDSKSRKKAKKKTIQNCLTSEKDKIVHRLLTSSFDIEKKDDVYCIYFSGLEEGRQLC